MEHTQNTNQGTHTIAGNTPEFCEATACAGKRGRPTTTTTTTTTHRHRHRQTLYPVVLLYLILALLLQPCRLNALLAVGQETVPLPLHRVLVLHVVHLDVKHYRWLGHNRGRRVRRRGLHRASDAWGTG